MMFMIPFNKALMTIIAKVLNIKYKAYNPIFDGSKILIFFFWREMQNSPQISILAFWAPFDRTEPTRATLLTHLRPN